MEKIGIQKQTTHQSYWKLRLYVQDFELSAIPSRLILPSVFSWYDLDLHFRLDELMEINFENS